MFSVLAVDGGGDGIHAFKPISTRNNFHVGTSSHYRALTFTFKKNLKPNSVEEYLRFNLAIQSNINKNK